MLNKKIIQVPIDEELLDSINRLSEKQGRSRADLIREACRSYLLKTRSDEMDGIYTRGYKRIPENSVTGETQSLISGETLPSERW